MRDEGVVYPYKCMSAPFSDEKVRIDEHMVIRIADTSAKTAVQALWSVSALNAVPVVTIPPAVTRIWPTTVMTPTISLPARPQILPIMSPNTSQIVSPANLSALGKGGLLWQWVWLLR